MHKKTGGFGTRPVSTMDRFRDVDTFMRRAKSDERRSSRGGSSKDGSRGAHGTRSGQTTRDGQGTRGGYSSRGTSSGSSFGSSRGGFGARKSFGHTGPRGGSRFGNRGKKKALGEHIDISKFINRATTVVEEVYTPTHTFNDFKVHAKLKENIANRGFVIPSPIQDQSIPNTLNGRDIIGLANTGTGKTAAFLIPTLNKIIHNSKQKAIIITPTRELAIQIQKECIELAKGLSIFNVTCVGGAPIRPQIQSLARKHNVIIGTPGRLKDLFEQKKLVLEDVSTVVLDEADRMLDMGFIDDVRYFLKHIPAEKQMLLFSATMAPAIESLVHQFLKNPVKISVKTRDTSKNVDQDVVRVADKTKKLDILCELLTSPEMSKVLVFAETKRSVDRLEKDLQFRKFKAEAIHGDKRHRERQRALTSFATGKTQILIATDVAARGLDISGVTHVINYEIPQSYDTYVHRIGRTGRGSATGKALTFV